MLVIDTLLIFLLLWISFKIVTMQNLFASSIYFIMFGMILSLIWIRLGAYDLAIAEIALGSGITGALLLDTIPFLKTLGVEDGK